MKTKPAYNNKHFSWGHLFLIAVTLYLAYVLGREWHLIRDGKQERIHIEDIHTTANWGIK